MGWFDFLKEENSNEHLEERSWGSGTSISSYFTTNSISEEDVIKIPTVQAILELIGGTIAQLPIYLYRENEDGSIERVVGDNREYLLNSEPNSMQTSYNFKKSLVKDFLLYGASYSYIEGMLDNKITSIYNLPSKSIQVKLYKKRGYKIEHADIILHESGNSEEAFKPDELLIILKDSTDGLTSKGALYYGQNIFKVINEEVSYTENIYKNGVLPLGVLQSKGRLTKDAIERLRESWSKLYGGSGNAGKTVILEEGLEYKPVSLNPRDLLLNENKKDNISDICRLFNIPESLVNPNANKYGSLEQNNISFLQYTLSPILSSIENGLNKTLLLEEEKRENYFFAFDTSEVLRTTEKEKYEAIKVGLDAGVITLNEARYKLNCKAIKDDIMKWSLGAVLYYPETGEMKIPNMGIGIEGYPGNNKNLNSGQEDTVVKQGGKLDEQSGESTSDNSTTSNKEPK